ncbi:MAG: HlyC/CorC family transporter [bacterium]|nr:MAG: HlyC/CorC family transporter [bacterium]
MEIILAILAIVLAGFFAGSETVFLSASKIKIEVLFRRKVKGIRRVYRFIKKPETFIVTALVGTNLSHVIFSSLMVLILRESLDEFLIVVFSSSMILIFSEIIPKAIAWEFANNLIIRTAQILNLFKIILYPINILLTSASNFLLRRFHVPAEQKMKDILTRTDLQKHIHESEKYGVIETEERKIITRIFNLRYTQVKETMIPRTDIIGTSSDASIPELKEKFNESGVSRIPVYDGNLDNIISVVYAKDLFFNPMKLNDIAQEIFYVPATKSAFELLQEFREKKMSIAVVLDEYGGTAGLVTIEDLIEELFGEIYDEFDIDHEHMYVFEDDRTIKIIARAEVDEINEKFNLNIPEGIYTTLGGFIIEKLGHIPKVGETIELECCKIIVEKASRKRVILVKLILDELILKKDEK